MQRREDHCPALLVPQRLAHLGIGRVLDVLDVGDAEATSKDESDHLVDLGLRLPSSVDVNRLRWGIIVHINRIGILQQLSISRSKALLERLHLAAPWCTLGNGRGHLSSILLGVRSGLGHGTKHAGPDHLASPLVVDLVENLVHASMVCVCMGCHRCGHLLHEELLLTARLRGAVEAVAVEVRWRLLPRRGVVEIRLHKLLLDSGTLVIGVNESVPVVVGRRLLPWRLEVELGGTSRSCDEESDEHKSTRRGDQSEGRQ
mmetsp:Transcript_29644/g.60891  ORF Transcript_29644/g.60891 Transcript_29644/m.60891 type:complete len:259 (+) Transcript_29644:811-1587(+)